MTNYTHSVNPMSFINEISSNMIAIANDEAKVKRIVERLGGYREKTIFNNPHTLTRSETWNNEHKVIYIRETAAEPDGHRDGFAVDIVTGIICG